MIAFDQSRAGKAPKMLYRFSLQHLADCAGKTKRAVQDDRMRGYVNPYNLASIVAYITRCQLKANKPRKKRRGKPSMPPKQSDSTT